MNLSFFQKLVQINFPDRVGTSLEIPLHTVLLFEHERGSNAQMSLTSDLLLTLVCGNTIEND